MQIIGKIKRTESQQVFISTQAIRGLEKIDIRVFFKDGAGKWQPTKRGLRIKFDEVATLSKLIEKAVNFRTD